MNTSSRLTKIRKEARNTKSRGKNSLNEINTPSNDKRQILIENDGYVFETNKTHLREQLDRVKLNEDLSTEDFSEFRLKCILQKADTKNRNGRIYPKQILAREADNYQFFINNGNAYGELDHPESKTVSLGTTSHLITKMYWVDNELHGELKLLLSPAFIQTGIVSTPGDVVANIILNGGRLGISSRGLGSVRQVRGDKVVQDDFELVCFDIVASPSTYDSYLFGKNEDLVKIDTKKGLGESKKTSNNNLVVENYIKKLTKN